MEVLINKMLLKLCLERVKIEEITITIIINYKTMVTRNEFKAQQRYWSLLDIINSKKLEAGINTIKISRYELSDHKHIADEERGGVLIRKLERRGGIKIIDVPYPYPVAEEKSDYKLEILPKFTSIHKKEKAKYDKTASGRDNDANTNLPKVKNYFVSFRKNREIWVNKIYLISKPHFNRDNETFFDFIYKKPDAELTREELKKNNIDLKKSFIGIISELGFTGEIKKVFFPSSGKDAVIFRKKATKDDIKKENIYETLLVKELEVAHLRMQRKRK